MKNCLDNIGTNIRRLRKERKMTIEDLSEKSGLSAKYLQGVETAKNNISVVNLENIAKALGIDMRSIIETSSEAFRHSENKLFHLSSRLKRYDAKKLSFVYEMLDIIEGLTSSEDNFLIPPKFKKDKAKNA